MKERKTPLSCLTEVWEQSENKQHQEAIEEMCQMNGLTYISLPRSGRKRGGGCALLYRSDSFSVTRLSVEVPKPAEALWTLLRPTSLNRNNFKLLICCFYSPPILKRNRNLVQHLQTTYDKLKIEHPTAKTLLVGDKNEMEEMDLVTIDPHFKQIVKVQRERIKHWILL